MLKEYVQQHVIITDGAMGTYYGQLTGKDTAFVELANLREPEVIVQIHRQYIAAGARLIRTNTFAANTVSLGIDEEAVAELIRLGYRLALQAVAQANCGQPVFVAADIGPIPDMNDDSREDDSAAIKKEYRRIIDTFLAEGAEVFVFETFSSTEYLAELAAYIKEKKPEAFVWTQFAMTPDGFTRQGIRSERIIQGISAATQIDACGFNCGSGPTHMYNQIKGLPLNGKIFSVLPNAGYPEVVSERTVYRQNPAYFASIMRDIVGLGAKLVGGCCGTTPEHIAAMTALLNGEMTARPSAVILPEAKQVIAATTGNQFYEKLANDEFVIAVELDPPFDTAIAKIMHGAKVCSEQGVDVITIADSPMAKARMDSIAIAAKIKRDFGIETMPHICCRDKNINALKSGLLAAHMEGIRNVLAVTGDRIPAPHANIVKSVFNVNSSKLMELIGDMNRENFTQDPVYIGGALNLNVINKQAEVDRLLRKNEKGAGFFLTQPIFDIEVIEFLAQWQRPKRIKVLGGIMPLVSYRNAQFLNNEVPGIRIPEGNIACFQPDMDKVEAEAIGIKLAVELAEKIRPYVDGFYFITPFNRIEMIMKIWQQVR